MVIAQRYVSNLQQAQQFAVDVDSVVASLAQRAPRWLKDAEEGGSVQRIAPTVIAHFSERAIEKKRWERAREGLGVLVAELDRMPPDVRRLIGREAFTIAERAADAGEDAGEVLQSLLGHLRLVVKECIAAISTGLPASDRDLQQRGRLGGIAAVFTRHGLPIGIGSDSPFVRVCEHNAGVSRQFIRSNLPKIRDALPQLVQETFGSPGIRSSGTGQK